MVKAAFGSGAAVIAVAVGIVALSYAPAGCGCTDVWSDYVVAAKLRTGKFVEEITAEELQAGLQRSLRGRKLTLDEFVFRRDKHGCSQQSPNAVLCHSVFETSPLLNRGFDVLYALDSDGRVQHVRVMRFIELRPNS